MENTITIEWKLPVEALKENNSREVLLQYNFIRKEVLRHELTHSIVHERR